MRNLLYSVFGFMLTLCPANGFGKTDFVTAETYGQLGNQIFMVSVALAYAWDNDLEPLFPFLNEKRANKRFNRDHFFFRVNASKLPSGIKKTWSSNCYVPIPKFKDVQLRGDLFYWKYFHHHREKLLSVYAFSEDILNYLNAKYHDLIENPQTVGVHVRTYAKRLNNFLKFAGMEYYRQALEKFPEDSLFVVFSDRIKWCQKHFTEAFPERKFVFIEGNDHIQDLALYSLMHSHIICNSTYSWWGAYLCTHPEQKVYAPMWYLLPPYKWVLEDYYLPEWEIIPYDFQHDPYPEDMYMYDEMSQSLHEKKR